jgi:hypothetical protein
MFKKIWKFLCFPVAIGIPLWLVPRRNSAGGRHAIHPQRVVFPQGAGHSDDPWIQRLVERDRSDQRQAAQDAGWQYQLALERGEVHSHESLGVEILEVTQAMFANDLGQAHEAGTAMLQAAHDDSSRSLDFASMTNSAEMFSAGYDAGMHDYGMAGSMGAGGML